MPSEPKFEVGQKVYHKNYHYRTGAKSNVKKGFVRELRLGYFGWQYFLDGDDVAWSEHKLYATREEAQKNV